MDWSVIINIIYIVISILSVFLYILSVQFKKKENILITQIGASLCYLIVYAIKGGWSGVAIEVIEETKDLAFIKVERKYQKVPMPILTIFLSLLVIVSIIFYDGPLSILPLFINILYFISTYFKNPFYIRVVMLINACLWIVYNIYLGAWIIVGGNILEIISAIVSIIRFKSEAKELKTA